MSELTIAEHILSESFQNKLKLMVREFDSMQPDGDSPINGYLSLNVRAALVTKHLGPFGFSLQQDVVEYPDGTVVLSVLKVMTPAGYLPWIRRYGSAKDAQRADGDVAQAGISAWRKILVALGLSNTVESAAVAEADERASMLMMISEHMTQQNIASLTNLVGQLRSMLDSFDMTMDQVKGLQLPQLGATDIKKIFNALKTINAASVSADAGLKTQGNKHADDGF